MDKESFDTYISLQQHLQSTENSYENWQKDDRSKTFRFDCQVNIISVNCNMVYNENLIVVCKIISTINFVMLHMENV